MNCFILFGCDIDFCLKNFMINFLLRTVFIFSYCFYFLYCNVFLLYL